MAAPEADSLSFKPINLLNTRLFTTWNTVDVFNRRNSKQPRSFVPVHTSQETASLDYVYQGTTVPGAVMLYHWLFSFAFAFLYVFLSVWMPKIRLWYGALYGIVITVVMHGLLIPALGFRNPVYNPGKTGWLWNMNGYEFWSELIGHICWSVSIEISLIAVLAIYAKKITGNWAV
ncbi:DUF1440 domain-containing protein [Erwinia psidii]|uniref:DUF1440 domain-containing protein n=1 Tax=Erwinia psidii TaxID=69224 RepID=A0A3N6SMW0_9GAMM|nr:DUF1440 domain-containing protein [Erwinia psidii]